jgi:hypothetical protein
MVGSIDHFVDPGVEGAAAQAIGAFRLRFGAAT